ncbi:MAG: hypothetical protein H0W23_04490 [Chloroflexia bacterium]|nr:hypothetical protein [Chloroflexia bacterium]
MSEGVAAGLVALAMVVAGGVALRDVGGLLRETADVPLFLGGRFWLTAP